MPKRGARDHKGGGKATHRWEGNITGGGSTQPHGERVDRRELEADRLKEDLEDAPTIK
ncbi:hypothetical protein GGP77_001625 [Salinibacter ruber]|nr:hypothetical protein [Salinibacter ruber]